VPQWDEIDNWNRQFASVFLWKYVVIFDAIFKNFLMRSTIICFKLFSNNGLRQFNFISLLHCKIFPIALIVSIVSQSQQFVESRTRRYCLKLGFVHFHWVQDYRPLNFRRYWVLNLHRDGDFSWIAFVIARTNVIVYSYYQSAKYTIWLYMMLDIQ